MHERDLPIVNTPACRHLLSKGMFITGKLNPSVEDSEIGDGNCWCGVTQHIVGPDNGLVERERCQSGRNCYEAVL